MGVYKDEQQENDEEQQESVVNNKRMIARNINNCLKMTFPNICVRY